MGASAEGNVWYKKTKRKPCTETVDPCSYKAAIALREHKRSDFRKVYLGEADNKKIVNVFCELQAKQPRY